MSVDPHYPIIYVRGFAMTDGEINETTADPFCGFNLGSTVFRATAQRDKARKFIFQSPVVRLASDFGYSNVYEDGEDLVEQVDCAGLSRRSVIIYRYYDSASELLGSGETPPLTDFASGLSSLIMRVRDLVCADKNNQLKPDEFKCYLVAHSMGGLVCRAMLQNPKCDAANARKYVDKFFTYATPHNGIDLGGKNVPKWLSLSDVNNFNRGNMAKYLALEDLYKKTERVDWLPEDCFPADRVFCLVGTNRTDYEAAVGLSRAFAGNGSDGLVRIDNATVCGVQEGTAPVPTAKAYVYRAHSGYFGIVNSEEAYQNLTRFLFGDLRVDIWLEVEDIRLPTTLEGKEKDIEALYQFEVLASPRGKYWYLTRRVAEEDSVACLGHQDWVKQKKKCSLYLSSVFLAKYARVNEKKPSLAYALTLGVRVPDYEVEKKLWINQHYEGGYLFRDTVVLDITPPQTDEGAWGVMHDWQSDNFGPASEPLEVKGKGEKVEVSVPFDNEKSPGIKGTLRFVVSRWND